MPVQGVFLDQVHEVRRLRYAWSQDGTVLLTLDCHVNDPEAAVLTFSELRRELANLCPWQQGNAVFLGLKHALAEVVTIYHAFEWTHNSGQTLMLISTPPEEYFEAASFQAATALTG